MVDEEIEKSKTCATARFETFDYSHFAGYLGLLNGNLFYVAFLINASCRLQSMFAALCLRCIMFL